MVVTFLSAIMTKDLVLDIGISSLQEVRTELKLLLRATGRSTSIAQDLLETRLIFLKHRATHLVTDPS